MQLGQIRVSPMGAVVQGQKLGFMIVASVPLQGLPPLTEAGVILVPDEPRRGAEAAIKAYANVAATLQRAKRHIASPDPYVAFLPKSEQELAYLEASKGIQDGFLAVPSAYPLVDLTDLTTDGLSDRLDGLELCAEAHSQVSSSGKFRELVRLFERAFGEHHMDRLAIALAQFLQGTIMGYTEEEVREWLRKTRHLLSHAGQRGLYLVDADVTAAIGRVEQAAYDVLFNKAQWNSIGTTRRNFWTPKVGTTNATSDVFLTQGADATLRYQVFDKLGGFTADLSAKLRTLPDGWWARNI